MMGAEVVTSPAVRRFLASDMGYRYGTYYDNPSERKIRGCKYIIQLEVETQNLAKDIFGSKFADFKPLGGQMVGAGVICGLMRPGDTVVEVGYGGQKVATRLAVASATKGLFKVEYWPFDSKKYQIDLDNADRLIRSKKPRLLILGMALPLFPDPVREICEIAEKVGAHIYYDASHLFGLIAGKVFPNPLKNGSDILGGSTTKTFPGPQGGMFLTKTREMYEKVVEGLYGLVCNHHLNRIPSLAAALLEMKQFGEEYAGQVIRNSRALGEAMQALGFEVLCADRGFSSTHLILVDVSKLGGGVEVASSLERSNIICHPFMLPSDVQGSTSGLRIGVQELTRIGMRESEMSLVADLYAQLLIKRKPASEVAENVKLLMVRFQNVDFSFDKEANAYC
jgi:glycine hydroxymethyltransferase